MIYEIDEQTIQAIKTLAQLADDWFDKQRVVQKRECDALRAANHLKKIVHAWDHDQKLFDQT